MRVLIDTSIWSLALRRVSLPSGEDQTLVGELAELIGDGRAAIIGPVRQELLSGISRPEQFLALQEKLQAFPDLSLLQNDFETAAEFFNRCRAAGIQGSHTDFLICAAAANRQLPVFTADRDFNRYAEHLPFGLYP